MACAINPHLLCGYEASFFFFLLCSGPNRGHYITIVKSHGFWLLFDDDIVEVNYDLQSVIEECSQLTLA